MRNIDNAIKKMNTANILLDAFGDGREFTMHDYKELAATANELFGGNDSGSNPCYSASWVSDHSGFLGVTKVGSRKIAIISSHNVYKRVYSEYFQHEIDRWVGTKPESKIVEQYLYRMDTTKCCESVIQTCKCEIQYEIDRVTARIEADQKYLEKLKNML